MSVGTRQKTLIFLVLLGSWASVANARSGRFGVNPIQEDLELKRGSRHKISDHSFGKLFNQSLGTGKSLDLIRAGRVGLDAMVRGKLRELNLHPSLEVRQRNRGANLFDSWSGVEKSRYDLFYNNTPICGFEIAAHRFRDASWVNGEVPVIDRDNSNEEWPELTQAVEDALTEGEHWGLDSSRHRVLTNRKCWRVVDQELQPAWELRIRFADGMPYEFMVGRDGVISKNAAYFDVSGHITAYVKNEIYNSGETESVAIADFVAGNKLQTTYFKSDPQTGTPVSESDYEFNYDPNTEASKFEEATAFNAAHSQYVFMNDVGYTWQGPKPLSVQIHTEFEGGEVNNARYIPYYGGEGPFIQVGDGDGIYLRNLATDRDVIAHEFGHHVVFRSLTKTSGESLVLHEALADYWAFTHAGDSCLGESVCPQNGKDVFDGGYCWVANSCLRTGSNSLKITDTSIPPSAHMVGQVISAMLWDLRTIDGIPSTAVDGLVHNAIDFLMSDSGYRDLILALLFADQEFYDSQYGAKIYLRAVARGFGSIIDDIHCKSEADCDLNSLPQLTGDPDDSSTTSKKSRKSSGGCGVVTHLNHNSQTPWGLVLVLLMPIILVAASAMPKPKMVRVRAYRTKK